MQTYTIEGVEYSTFQYRKRQVLFPHHLCFTFSSFRYLRCADLIVALLLCCLASFGAFRKRQVLLQLQKLLRNQFLSALSFNTASGRYCCNVIEDNICTCGLGGFNTVNGRCCCNLMNFVLVSCLVQFSFNTVNGRCCCNLKKIRDVDLIKIVSIPQAVGTVSSSSSCYLRFAQVLEMRGPHRRFAPLLSYTLRRIP